MRDDDDLIGELDFQTRLTEVLWEHLPNHRRQGDRKELDARKIADDLGISTKAFYAWFKRASLSNRKLKALMSLDGSTLTVEILFPFTFQN